MPNKNYYKGQRGGQRGENYSNRPESRSSERYSSDSLRDDNRDYYTGESERYSGGLGPFTGGDFGRGFNPEYRPDPSTWGGHGAYEGVYDRPAKMQSRYGSDPNNSGRDAYDRNRNYEFDRGRRSSREDWSLGSYGSSYPERGRYLESERGYETHSNYDDDRGWWDKAADEVSSWMGDEDAARRREMDARYGSHRGKGPKNYTRSDDRIKEDVNDRLTDYTYLDASDITVEVNNCEVVLTGTVQSRYAKRMAEDIADDVSGVKNVENRLRVSSSANSWDFGTNTPDTFSASDSMQDSKSLSKKA